eukprot:m.1165785 g.1165785  ORF g.1165785 m.1165785 type:complete len:632 (+) comp24503_c0_seq15:2473-4368(+)
MKKRPTSHPIPRIKHINPHTGKESKPLTDWNADIYGPIATPSLFENHRYILSFIDRNTKTIINAYLQRITSTSISEGINIFSQQLASLQQQHSPNNIDIILGKTIKTDSATYFKTQEVHATLQKHGFHKHLYSPPHTQAHNGIIERSFQTIPPSARAMLHASNLTESLWPEAYAQATYIYDIMPHTGNQNNMSPFEARTGTKPTINTLHPFGAKCWSWTPQRHKSDQKSIQGTYIGRHPASNSHQLYIRTKTGRHLKIAAYHIKVDTTIPPSAYTIQPPIDDDECPHAEAAPPTTIDLSIQRTVHATSTSPTYYSLQQALNSDYGYLFEDCYEDEIGYFLHHKVLIPILRHDINTDEYIHRTTALYTPKFNEKGEAYKGKLRLVFSSKNQVKGEHYLYKSSHTPKWPAILLHNALQPTDPTRTITTIIDIKKAYIQATPKIPPNKQRTIINLPRDLRQYDPHGQPYYYILTKPLYGQVDAGLQWQQTLFAHLKSTHWKQSIIEPTLFTKTYNNKSGIPKQDSARLSHSPMHPSNPIQNHGHTRDGSYSSTAHRQTPPAPTTKPRNAKRSMNAVDSSVTGTIHLELTDERHKRTRRIVVNFQPKRCCISHRKEKIRRILVHCSITNEYKLTK